MADAGMWARRVDDWRASGRTAKEFSEGREFSAGGLRYWAYRLKRERAVASSDALVPVARVVRTLAPASPGQRLAEPVPIESSLVVEVGAARIAVRPGFDAATLAAVVEALAPRKGTP